MKVLGIISIVTLVLLAGCGGGARQQERQFELAIMVAVSPSTAQLDQGAKQQFTTTVTGTTNTAVAWSVQEPGGGSVTQNGMYTAPAAAGAFHVVATSVADGTKTATSTVTVPDVSLALAPTGTLYLDQGASWSLTATVTGTTNTVVSWSVQEPGGGIVSQNGVYTAPTAAGTYHVIATSSADVSKTAALEVIVPDVSVDAIRADPEGKTPSVCQGNSIQLVADVSGTVITDVTWAVQEPDGGSITPAGLYTAPATAGIFHIVAISVADPSKSRTGGVDVGRIRVKVTPDSIRVTKSRTQFFYATVSGCTTDTAVTWSVFEGATGGTVSQDGPQQGWYTAPDDAGGTFHLLAASVTHPNMTGRATVQVMAEGFYPTGDMSVRRGFHTATRLPSGEVLVVGGTYVCDFESGDDQPFCYAYDPADPIPVWSTAELFDPATGQFRATGQMSTPRMGHAAVLLPNGKVLVIGGSDQNDSPGRQLSTAELYDPATGSFSPTGSMAVARYAPTATLLPNGKVLVAGGGRGYPANWQECATRSAEIYDPAIGNFLPAGDMASRRANHTATLLADGRVLLAGGLEGGAGCGGGLSLVSSEFFDPATNSFSFAANMNLDRDSQAATLLEDGRVLVSGGWRFSDLSGDGGPWSEAEILDPDTQSFTTRLMAKPRVFHTATLLTNGQVLLTGGQPVRDITIWYDSSAELFDPTSQTFTLISGMGTSRGYGHTATLLLDGSVLITGGALGNSAELYK